MAAHTGRAGARPADVLTAVAHGQVEPVYVLFGGDTAITDDVISALKQAIIEPGLEPFDMVVRHAPSGSEPHADWVVETLQLTNQPPMGSKRRLVVIRDLARMDKRSLGELCAGLARTPDFCTVVAISAYDAGVKKALSAGGLGRYVVNLYEPRPDDLVVMIRRWAREQKLEITPEAAVLLCDICGSDTGRLRGELEKLATALGPGQRADAESVRRLAGASREYSLKEYVQSALGRDPGRALYVLRRLAQWGEEPMRIIAWLTTDLLRLVSEQAGQPAEQRGRWNARELDRALFRLYEINRAYLTGHPETFALLDMFTVCLGCRGTTAYCGLFRGAGQPDFCMRRPLGAARRRAANVE